MQIGNHLWHFRNVCLGIWEIAILIHLLSQKIIRKEDVSSCFHTLVNVMYWKITKWYSTREQCSPVSSAMHGQSERPSRGRQFKKKKNTILGDKPRLHSFFLELRNHQMLAFWVGWLEVDYYRKLCNKVK